MFTATFDVMRLAIWVDFTYTLFLAFLYDLSFAFLFSFSRFTFTAISSTLFLCLIAIALNAWYCLIVSSDSAVWFSWSSYLSAFGSISVCYHPTQMLSSKLVLSVLIALCSLQSTKFVSYAQHCSYSFSRSSYFLFIFGQMNVFCNKMARSTRREHNT